MPPLYVIHDWQNIYETSESKRGKVKEMRWLPLRNKMDSLGFKMVAEREDRCELMAAWVLMLQIASKGPAEQRGKLERNGKPLTPDLLRTISGFPSEIFKQALNFFSDPGIGWIEVVDNGEVNDIPEASPEKTGYRPEKVGLQDRTGQDKNRTLHNTTEVFCTINQQVVNTEDWKWIVGACRGDQYTAARCLFRAKEAKAKNIMAYVKAGAKRGYIFEACEIESEKGGKVNAWCEKLIDGKLAK